MAPPIEIEYGKVEQEGEDEIFVGEDLTPNPWVIGPLDKPEIHTYSKDGQALFIKVINSTTDEGGIIQYGYTEDPVVLFRKVVIGSLPGERVLIMGEETIVKKFKHSKEGTVVGFRARHIPQALV